MKEQASIYLKETRKAKTRKKVNVIKRKRVLFESINKSFEKYVCRNISIHKCLAKTGTLTAALIVNYIPDLKSSKSAYDSISLLAAAYYAMLHMDMYTGFYSIKKEYICYQLERLLKDTLVEINRNRSSHPEDSDSNRMKSHDICRQMVEAYYTAGLEGCLKHVSFSIRSLADKPHLLKRNELESLLRTIQAEKFLAQA